MSQVRCNYIKTHLNSRTSLPNVAGRHKYLRGPKVLRNPVLSRAILYFSPFPLSIPKRVFLNPPLGGYSSPSHHSPSGIGQLDKGLRPAPRQSNISVNGQGSTISKTEHAVLGDRSMLTRSSARI